MPCHSNQSKYLSCERVVCIETYHVTSLCWHVCTMIILVHWQCTSVWVHCPSTQENLLSTCFLDICLMIAAWSYKIQWPLLFLKPFRAPLKDSKRQTNLDTIHPLRLGLFIDCACNFPTDSNQDIALIKVNGGIQLQRNLKRNAVHKGITQGERERQQKVAPGLRDHQVQGCVHHQLQQWPQHPFLASSSIYPAPYPYEV